MNAKIGKIYPKADTKLTNTNTTVLEEKISISQLYRNVGVVKFNDKEREMYSKMIDTLQELIDYASTTKNTYLLNKLKSIKL